MRFIKRPSLVRGNTSVPVWSGLSLAGITLACVLSACGGDDDQAEEPKWAQTWSVAPAYAPAMPATPLRYFPNVAAQSTGITAPGIALTAPLTPPADTTNTATLFSNTTIRQFVRVSVGGPAVRLRLANGYGASDVVISDMRVALADKAACPAANPVVAPATEALGVTCSNIMGSTTQPVTVGGTTAFTIPAGKDIYSDAIKLAVPNQAFVAVSFYVKDLTPPLNTHGSANATTYLVTGLPGTTANFTAASVFNDATLNGTAALATGSSNLVVSGIDTMVPPSTRVIIAFGDSITDGGNILKDTATRWADALANRFIAAAPSGKTPAVVSSVGIDGNRVLTETTNGVLGLAGIKRFKVDVLDRSGVTDVIVLQGVNDLHVSAGETAERIIGGYQDLIAQAHAKKLKIYFATITPFRTDVGVDTTVYGSHCRNVTDCANMEAVRLATNDWILSTKEHDGAIDFNGAVAPAGRTNVMKAEWNLQLTTGGRDQIHPNKYGLSAMADSVNLTWFGQ